MKHKPHLEFATIDRESGWERPSGYKHGFWQKILAGELDETNKTGNRSRLLRIDPGVYSEQPFIHEYWEEVFLAEGDLIVGNDAQGNGGEQFVPATYACRPPGVAHGPFKSENGCLLFELHYFLPKDATGNGS